MIAISIITILYSCKKELSKNNTTDGEHSAQMAYDGNTILGESVNNPYTLSNMQAALRAMGKNTEADNLQANRIYVKLKPESREQVFNMLSTENEKRLISEYPIDRKVELYGSYYVDDEATDTILKPYYCVAFSVNDLPRVPYEILGYGYVPNDNEEDVEQKAWDIAGYTERDENGEVAYKTSAVGFYPSGSLEVLKAPTTTYVACRHKSVMATTFFKWSYMRTDASGKFNSSVKFLVPALFYIRYWNQEYQIFGHSLTDYLGQVKRSNQGKIWQIDDNRKAAWHKATINNTVHDYNDYANTIPTHRVNNARLWLPWGSPSSRNSGSTIMMHYFGFQPHEISPADLACPYQDIGIYVWDNLNYDTHRRLLFHEFSHWSHAITVGRPYWKDVCRGEGQNVYNTLTPPNRPDYGDPYRDGLNPTTTLAQNFGYTEAWAEFGGAMCCLYNGVFISNSALEFFEPKSIPHLNPNGNADAHYNSWMPTGLFYDLWDRNNESNQKDVNGAPIIKDCFTLSLPYMYSKLNGATNIGEYKSNLLATTPQSEQDCLINLFKGYGY